MKQLIVMTLAAILAVATSAPVAFAVKPKVPAAPTNLSATAASASQINLKWTDNATNESNYVVERSTDGTTFSTLTLASALTPQAIRTGGSLLRPPTTTG